MPTTSSVNKSNNQRTNYNESSIPQRHILPMSTISRPVQTYQQPQIIVPTQCGFGDVSKEMSSTVLLPQIDYYDNMQINCFGQIQPFQPYFPQQQQQQIYSQPLQQQQYFQQHNQIIQQSSRVIPRTMSSINNVSQQQQQHQQHSTPMNHTMTPSHVVPTQSLPLIPLDSTDVSQSISDYSMSASLSDPIDFSLGQSPTICYEENSNKKSCSKNSVLNDVFFSDPADPATEEVLQVLHFDSDSSSDTDISTPHLSPPLTPIDLMRGDDVIWDIIYQKLDLSNDKSFTESSFTNMSETEISSSPSSDVDSSVSSEVASSTMVMIPPPPSMNASVTSLPSSSNSTSNVTTINPSLITIPDTIDPRFIDIDTTTVAQNVVKKLVIRPNHIEFGDDIPSPPLPTPELVSDHSIKRRLSCESSSDDDMSDADSNDKRAQKKFRVDLKKSIKVSDDKRNDDEEDEEEESDSEESSVNDNDEDMDSSNEVQDISDTVTDEYHYSSDTESEEDDDEYRPTNNNKKARVTRKVVKTQGKARSALSKGSLKTKSSSTKKSKMLSTKRGKQSSKTSKPSSKRSSGVSTPVPIESPPQCFSTPEESQEMEGLEVTSPRPTQSPTIFQTLTKSGIDWCRYCGTTEGVNWRPGPWGKRTLCNKHGCDYKGYGFACKLPRLDLTGFVNESVEDRDRPVLQLFCTVCQKKRIVYEQRSRPMRGML